MLGGRGDILPAGGKEAGRPLRTASSRARRRSATACADGGAARRLGRGARGSSSGDGGSQRGFSPAAGGAIAVRLPAVPEVLVAVGVRAPLARFRCADRAQRFHAGILRDSVHSGDSATAV